MKTFFSNLKKWLSPSVAVILMIVGALFGIWAFSKLTSHTGTAGAVDHSDPWVPCPNDPRRIQVWNGREFAGVGLPDGVNQADVKAVSITSISTANVEVKNVAIDRRSALSGS